MQMITENDFQELECVPGFIPQVVVDKCHRPDDDTIVSAEPLFITHRREFMRISYIAKTSAFVVHALECQLTDSIIVNVYSRQGEYTYVLGHRQNGGYAYCFLVDGTPTIALKVFGRNWGRIVDWVNEFMEYGMLEDAIACDQNPTSYIK